MPPSNTARKLEPNSSFQNVALPARSQTLHAVSATSVRKNPFQFSARAPVIIGEATCRGWLPVDGLISGQLNGNGGALSVKQRTAYWQHETQPELRGEIVFKDMVRINGHIEGKVSSEKGTLIIAESAVVDASIDVGTAVINGKVNGDVVGHERVELGPRAIINGSISSPRLTIKPGAVFCGQCRMTQLTTAAPSRERYEQQCFRFE